MTGQTYTMYIYLSSDNSKQYYKGNDFFQFTVELPSVLYTENCEITLKSVYFKKTKELRNNYFHVFCDCIQPSIVNGQESSILGTFFEPGATDTDQYHSITTNYLKRLTFRIYASELSKKDKTDSTLYMTLHIREKT